MAQDSKWHFMGGKKNQVLPLALPQINCISQSHCSLNNHNLGADFFPPLGL